MTKKSAYKIMVVEDEAVIALNLQQMLTKMGYDVIGVSYSGEEALEKARSLRPDLILMDIMMPGKLDGIAAAKIIKAELGIPVVFLTAYSEDKIIESAKQTEPYGYILKPSQDREIKATVKIALYKKEMEKALQDSESKLSAMLASVGDHMSMMDKDLNIIWANEIAEKIFGNDIIGKKCYEVYHKRTEPCEPYPCITVRAFQDGTIHEHDTQVIDKDGKTIFFHCTANVALRDKEGKPTAVLEISRDITEKVRAGKALHKAKNELEYRVKERTRELEIKTNSLEEINTAMKVLLNKRENDKTEIEDNVLTNVKELIGPFFKKIKNTKLDDQQKTFLSIIESNLNEIISPFTRKMSLKYLNLTPAEIRIANLIRHGSNSKEIAELLNVSPRTVETHRKNIRRKIGLEGKRANLRSHLLSLL